MKQKVLTIINLPIFQFFNLLIFFVLLICCTSGSEAKAGVPYPEASGEIGKTLVVYYSYTGNCRDIVSALTDQIEADVLEIQPADKGQRYEANGYALGTQLLNAIKANPDDPASYPPIDPVSTTLTDYRNIIVVTPLWWSQMAAIMQTYLFNYGPQMAGKTIAMIVSSSSSGISGVVADCKRLVPDATWAGDALWIKDSNRRNTATLVQEWLSTQNFQSSQTNQMTITIDGQSHSVTLADTQAAQQLAVRLHDGPVTTTLSSSSDFEIWGPLGFSLPTSNEQITAKPGDVILYNGSNICLFYGTNTWSYTRLGHIDGLTESELRTFLKAGESRITVTLSLEADPTAIKSVEDSRAEEETYYTLNGVKVAHPTKGLYVKGGKKIAL